MELLFVRLPVLNFVSATINHLAGESKTQFAHFAQAEAGRVQIGGRGCAQVMAVRRLCYRQVTGRLQAVLGFVERGVSQIGRSEHEGAGCAERR